MTSHGWSPTRGVPGRGQPHFPSARAATQWPHHGRAQGPLPFDDHCGGLQAIAEVWRLAASVRCRRAHGAHLQWLHMREQTTLHTLPSA